jgi:chromosome partitioning protein
VLDGLEDRYDVAIADTAPTLTTTLANALVWTEEVIVPLDPGVYAVLGLVQLQEIIEQVREAYGNTSLRLSGLLLTKGQRNNVARDVESELRSRFGPIVFKSTIPSSAVVEAAHSRGLTVLDHAPKSAPALAYLELVEEIDHGIGQQAERSRGQAGKRTRKSPAA